MSLPSDLRNEHELWANMHDDSFLCMLDSLLHVHKYLHSLSFLPLTLCIEDRLIVIKMFLNSSKFQVTRDHVTESQRESLLTNCSLISLDFSEQVAFAQFFSHFLLPALHRAHRHCGGKSWKKNLHSP